MKCIQLIKSLKSVELNTLARVDNVDAEAKVQSGYWSYVPKSKWKTASRAEVVEAKVEAASQEKTISAKQINRKKNK
jgi:hypothetical protein